MKELTITHFLSILMTLDRNKGSWIRKQNIIHFICQHQRLLWETKRTKYKIQNTSKKYLQNLSEWLCNHEKGSLDVDVACYVTLCERYSVKGNTLFDSKHLIRQVERCSSHLMPSSSGTKMKITRRITECESLLWAGYEFLLLLLLLLFSFFPSPSSLLFSVSSSGFMH